MKIELTALQRAAALREHEQVTIPYALLGDLLASLDAAEKRAGETTAKDDERAYRSTLIAVCDALGIEFDGKWTADTLAGAIIAIKDARDRFKFQRDRAELKNVEMENILTSLRKKLSAADIENADLLRENAALKSDVENLLRAKKMLAAANAELGGEVGRLSGIASVAPITVLQEENINLRKTLGKIREAMGIYD